MLHHVHPGVIAERPPSARAASASVVVAACSHQNDIRMMSRVFPTPSHGMGPSAFAQLGVALFHATDFRFDSANENAHFDDTYGAMQARSRAPLVPSRRFLSRCWFLC
jgi:hypothetical protein